ncbi:ATP synthase F0 subunit B [Kitasatospora sp. NPDC059646]|uniref:ATP synthase F0 subunit B n=1 Tax=Kitasatospora sp. NPDC059646 TaxID=3346893 RepID=UPI0036AE36F5
MDVQQKLDEIISLVEKAKAMPMSASCVVNRAELTGMLRELRDAMPAELAQAQSVVADHQQMVADAQAQADQIIRGAHDERGSLISDTEVVRQAQAEADRILAEARTEERTKRAEADDYVDSKLANFEVVLTKTLGAVGRGRQKLRGESGVYQPEGEGAEDGEEFQPQRISPSPEADEYVDVKLATLEAVLSATLEAVGKGRDKLLGKAPIDELGAYLAAADEAQQLKDRAEAVAAGFAADGEQSWYADVPQQQSWPEQTPAAAGWQNPAEDPYGQPQAPQYAEVYGGGYDPAAAPQTDPYGQPYGYQQQVDPAYYQQQAYQQPGYDQWGNPLPADQNGYPQQPQQQPHVPQQQAGLDETSFFDTSMIDMTRLRELGGR